MNVTIIGAGNMGRGIGTRAAAKAYEAQQDRGDADCGSRTGTTGGGREATRCHFYDTPLSLG